MIQHLADDGAVVDDGQHGHVHLGRAHSGHAQDGQQAQQISRETKGEDDPQVVLVDTHRDVIQRVLLHAPIVVSGDGGDVIGGGIVCGAVEDFRHVVAVAVEGVSSSRHGVCMWRSRLMQSDA